MRVEVRELRQPVRLTPAVLLLVGVGDLDARMERFFMDTEGLNGPEGGAGLGSIERGADPGALLPGGLVKNRLNRSGVSVTGKTHARSSSVVVGRSRPRRATSWARLSSADRRVVQDVADGGADLRRHGLVMCSRYSVRPGVSVARGTTV